MKKIILLFSLATSLLAGCANYQVVAYGREQNFLSFDHAFTDQATADVLAVARKLCVQKLKAAVQTSRACSLDKCTTNYQCADQADVTKDSL